jgi:hypothetical protein
MDQQRLIQNVDAVDHREYLCLLLQVERDLDSIRKVWD